MKRLKRWRWLVLGCGWVIAAGSSSAALYRVGDVMEEFTLRERGTGRWMTPADFAGKIVVLDWFAWWCPYCQAAAPQLLSGIKEHYAARGGNPGGIPVVHVGVNLQGNQESQTQNFVNRAGYEVVLEDFGRTLANRIATGGQPLFAIFNGVTNSPSHRPWQLLYSRAGYGQTTFPVAEFRAAIDAVLPPPPDPTPAPRLSRPQRGVEGQLDFILHGRPGRSYRIESSTDLRSWRTERAVVPKTEAESVRIDPIPMSGNVPGAEGRFVRVAVD